MAFPWTGGPGINYADFINLLLKFDGVKLATSNGNHFDEDGSSEIVYLYRDLGDFKAFVPLSFSMEGEIVLPRVIESVCEALKIDKEVFSKI